MENPKKGPERRKQTLHDKEYLNRWSVVAEMGNLEGPGVEQEKNLHQQNTSQKEVLMNKQL